MRSIAASVSAFALAAAFSVPAMAQQGTPQQGQGGPLFFVIPAQPAQTPQQTAPAAQPDQQRVIIVTPDTLQAPAQIAPQAQATTPALDVERFAREIAQRAYLQGRIDERQAGATGAAQLTQADLERLASQLFERGYMQGRFEGQLRQLFLSQTQQQASARQLREALEDARTALDQGNTEQARQAFTRIDSLLGAESGGNEAGGAQNAGTGQGQNGGTAPGTTGGDATGGTGQTGTGTTTTQ